MKKNILLSLLISITGIGSIAAMQPMKADWQDLLKSVYYNTGLSSKGTRGPGPDIIAYEELIKRGSIPNAIKPDEIKDYQNALTELRAALPLLERNDLIGLVRNNDLMGVAALLKRGVSITKTDAAGKTALDYANEYQKHLRENKDQLNATDLAHAKEINELIIYRLSTERQQEAQPYEVLEAK